MSGLSYLPGTDAYYLIEQAQFVFETGRLKIHDGNPIPFFMAAVMHLGFSAETAFVVFFVALLSAFAVLLSFQIKNLRALYLPLAVLVANVFAYQAFEFPKITLATLFFLIGLHFSGSKSKLFIFGAFAALAHRAFVPIAVLTTLLEWIHPRTIPRPWVLAGAALFLAALPFSGVASLVLRPNLSRLLTLSVSSSWLMFTIVGFGRLWRGDGHARLPLLLLGFALLPEFGTEIFNVGERYALVSVCLGGFASFPLFDVTASRFSQRLAPVFVFIVVLLVIGMELPRSRYDRIAKLTSELAPKKLKMVIAPRDFKFYYTAKTGRDAFFFEPDADWPKSSVWRVAQNITREEFSFYLPPQCQWTSETIEPLGIQDVYLIREDCWNQFRQRISETDMPHLYDRVWDHELNPSRPRTKFPRMGVFK